MPRLVVIRADASRRIGSGHVMRCLSLASVLRARGRTVEFVSRILPGNLIDLVQGQGFVVHALQAIKDEGLQEWLGVSIEQDLEETLAAIATRQVEWLIVDHYGLDAHWERAIAPCVDRIMVIDDLANRNHDCHLLLDQNFSLDPSKRYIDRLPPSCTTLLGPKFALLREEFARARASLRVRDGKVRKALVFFGGSDPRNLTGQALQIMASPGLDDIEIDVVVGASNPHRDDIVKRLGDKKTARLLVQIDNMAELMAAADLSIGAGGSTTWERMCLGLPSVVVTIAENQVQTTRDLHTETLVRWVGHIGQTDPKLLGIAIAEVVANPSENLSQSERAMRIVDGLGAERVASVMCESIAYDSLKVRRALPEDRALYWHWVNDRVVRTSAIKRAPIPWADHIEWFNDAVADPNKWLFIVDGLHGPVGQARFERIGNVIWISYSVAAQFRGRGLGASLLALAIERLASEFDQKITLHATVNSANAASVHVFRRLGFAEGSSQNEGFLLFHREIEKGAFWSLQ